MNIRFLPDLQLQLALIRNPHQSDVPPSFHFDFLPLPPPRAPLLPSPPPSGSLTFLVSVVLDALWLSALFCWKLSVRIQTIYLVLKENQLWKSLKLLGANLVGLCAGRKFCKLKLLRNAGSTDKFERTLWKFDWSHFPFPKLCLIPFKFPIFLI